MLWAYGSYAGGRILVLLTMIILARQLTPADFGLVALALIFITVLETIGDLGATASLVIADERDLPEQADTAWTFTVLVGFVLSVMTALLSPFAASAFGEPQLTGVLAALGLIFFLRSLGLAHYALAQRRLDFRSRTKAELADISVRGIVGIGLALGGFGVWSLVASYLIGALTSTVMLWRLVDWRPSLRLNRPLLRTQLRFGGPLTADSILWAVSVSVDRAFVGPVLGAAALGLYVMASRLPDLLISNLSMIASRVLFAAYARMDREAMIQAFLLSTRYTLLLALPLGVGLAALADPLVHALFGSKWAPAVPAMQALTIYAVAVTLAVPSGTVYKALRRADMLLVFTVPRLVALVMALVLFSDQGILAVALCQAVTSVAADLAAAAVASHMLQVPLRRIGAAVWPPVVVAFGVGVVLVPVERLIASPGLALLAGTLAGGAAYALLAWLTARDSILALIRAVVGTAGKPGGDVMRIAPDAGSGGV